MKLFLILILFSTNAIAAENYNDGDYYNYVTDKGEPLQDNEYCLHGILYFQDNGVWNTRTILKGKELDENNKAIHCNLKKGN